jgi:hypothetical protein
MKYFNQTNLTKEASPNGNSKEKSCKESCKEESSSEEKSSKEEINFHCFKF